MVSRPVPWQLIKGADSKCNHSVYCTPNTAYGYKLPFWFSFVLSNTSFMDTREGQSAACGVEFYHITLATWWILYTQLLDNLTTAKIEV